MSLQVLLLGLFVVEAHASIFCPHTAYPSTSNSDEFVVSSIQNRQRPGQEAYYRITDDTNDPAYKRNSSRFRLMTTRDSSECPYRGCLVELSPVEPKNHGTLLYQTSVIGKMIPPGFFAMDVARRFYCVVTDGDCGATIPLYRHYKWSPTGIFHAYSLESDEVIDGYAREPTPLCYVWPKDRPQAEPVTPSTIIPPLTDIIDKLLPKPLSTPAPAEKSSSNSNEDNAVIESDDLCEGGDHKAFDSSMKRLREYYNGESGAKSDHWYSTKKTSSNYKPKAILGKVITDAKSTNCKCLVQLSQMKFETEDKTIVDHKLVRIQNEPISLYQYKTTGEEVYCSRRENACGATVPLRKFYNLADSDSLLTAGSEEAPLNSSPSPADVLCWIWPKNYHQDSTEDELRKESMNVVKVTKSQEVSGEVVEGSGAEPQKSEVTVVEKKIVNDEPKVEKKPASKKPKSEKKKSKKRKNKAKSEEKKKPVESEEKKVELEEKKKPVEPKSPEVIEKSSKETSIEAEEQIGEGKLLKFESSETKTVTEKPIEKSVEKVKEESAPVSEETKHGDDKSLLDVDEEKVRELAKFQSNKRGKEPTEIEEQHDSESTMLRFEDIAPKQ